MEIVKAEVSHADIIGRVHSKAWQQAYKDVFPDEYLKEDTPEKRTQEFLDSCNDKDIWYYMIYEDAKTVGIVKLINDEEKCEISSFYILDGYRNRGLGKQVIEYYVFYEEKEVLIQDPDGYLLRFSETQKVKNDE